jgi:arabinan endo-1,5-alpha-L-arabinosidase
LWLAFLIVLLWGLGTKTYALQGLTGVHDPSTIIKDGNRYWIFATGNGIYSMSSTDLINWTPGPRAVFVNNAYPSWINTKVPGFQGHFWAPECFYMNGKFHLYYSCSTFGSKVSAIGLVTNVTLDPTSPDYRWTDQGEVISTNTNSSVNAIDPAVFRDANNNVWFTYGSFFGGLRTTQINPATGKLQGTSDFSIANGDVEAAYTMRHGAYYYLFINRGSCCQGVNSTYVALVGRSTSPSGPFLDKNGVDLNNNGGSVVLNTSGRYIGPGHIGVLEEGGASYVSHHYYDRDDNGVPKLGLANLTWDAADWPVINRDWVKPGRYEITNQNSGLVWDAWGCTGVSGQMIAQGVRSGLACQQWNFTAVGNGEYKITNALGGLTADVSSCSPNAGAKLQLLADNGQDCQRFRLDRTNDGTYIFASVNGNRVVEVPVASTIAGTQLGLWDYNGCTCQRWTVSAVGTPTPIAAANLLMEVSLYPIPAVRGSFTVELGNQQSGVIGPALVQVFNLQGRKVYQQEFAPQQRKLAVDAALAGGVYLVQVRQGSKVLTQKVTVE